MDTFRSNHEILSDEEYKTYVSYFVSIGEIAVPEFSNFLNDSNEDKRVRLISIRALDGINSPQALQILQDFITHGDESGDDWLLIGNCKMIFLTRSALQYSKKIKELTRENREIEKRYNLVPILPEGIDKINVTN